MYRRITCQNLLPYATRFDPTINFSWRQRELIHPRLEYSASIIFGLKQARNYQRFPDPYRLGIGLGLEKCDQFSGKPHASRLKLTGLARLFSERSQLCAMIASYLIKIKKALQIRLLYATLTELNPAQLGIGRPPEALSGLILGQADMFAKSTQLSSEPAPTGEIRIATRRHLRLLDE